MKSTICTILVGIVIGIAAIFYVEKSTRLAHEILTLETMLDDCHAVIKEQADHVQTIDELQRGLKRLGLYEGELDSIWGKGSTEALKRHSFNGYALVYFDPNTYRSK
ncbi:hypothetical protein LCGC14_0376050 [marine sediment metagenome]|uniref:Uncharacterized protein n=1 Tax=marine sediment metagenome TaxID=412755 RepID=A0A0F9TLX1_9ZZZZ